MIKKALLILVILIAATLRLWELNNFPVGFNADEAAIGYNAYSLLQTGKDEYGTPFPLSFKSFGDFKPGLYFYFVTPFVAALGLNEWAVRLPSALFGIGTVILIYYLAKEIFKNESIGIISAFLLAISPWHLQFSRGGWESNAATFFIALGIFLFVRSFKNVNLLFWSLISFLASMYTYQSPRLVVPALVLVLLLLYKDKFIESIRKNTRRALLCGVILIFFTIPLIIQFTSNQATSRFSGLSFLSDTGPASRVNELRGEHKNQNSKFAILTHNKFTAYVPNLLGHYLDHFRPDFLFINGDPLIRDKVPETGQFYLIESIFLIIGLVFILKDNLVDKKLIFIWLLLAPIASSLTYQTPHALRALNMVIPWILIISYGLYKSIFTIKKGWRNALIIILFLTLSFEFVHYLESYYTHYPKRYPLAWEYGFKEMVSKLNKYEKGFDRAVITDRYDQPYILILFYKMYDPKIYQPQAKLSERDKFNFGTVRSFDKYQFREIKQDEVLTDKTLYIVTEQELPKNAKILDKVNFPDGKPAFLFISKETS